MQRSVHVLEFEENFSTASASKGQVEIATIRCLNLSQSDGMLPNGDSNAS
jgi:hypothetical protein